MIRKLILIKNIKVQNANALSSPYTIGFPAVTSWLGAVHALQRHIRNSYEDLSEVEFKAVAIICHQFSLNVNRESYDNHIILSKNPPATRLDENFIKKRKPKSFIPEPVCNLNCSLLIEHNLGNSQWSSLCESVNAVLNTKIKIAGGDILKSEEVNQNRNTIFTIDENEESELRFLIRKLMPGYFIKERRDLMLNSMKEGHCALDALLDHLKVTNSCKKDRKGNVYWEQSRRKPGWVVPIATGFQGITEIKKVSGQRDFNTPHRFAEAVVTLGEFVMPYRIQKLDEMFWYYHVEPDKNLYLCQQSQ